MKEKNPDILRKAIEDLPVFKVESQYLWEYIERQLPFDSIKEKGTLPKLPEFKAPESVWQKIEIVLESAEISKKRRITPILVKWSAAAAILILAGYLSLNWFRNYNQQAKYFNASQTEIQEGHGIESIYNPALCNNNPQVCSTDLFKELDKQLNEINSELETMKPMIKGNDPQLLKYYYRLENEKAEIEKKMVKIIMQS